MGGVGSTLALVVKRQEGTTSALSLASTAPIMVTNNCNGICYNIIKLTSTRIQINQQTVLLPFFSPQETTWNQHVRNRIFTFAKFSYYETSKIGVRIWWFTVLMLMKKKLWLPGVIFRDSPTPGLTDLLLIGESLDATGVHPRSRLIPLWDFTFVSLTKLRVRIRVCLKPGGWGDQVV